MNVRFVIGRNVNIRRDILQLKDSKLINNLKFKFKKTNIIFTNYKEYSRDKRINNMRYKIKKLKKL